MPSWPAVGAATCGYATGSSRTSPPCSGGLPGEEVLDCGGGAVIPGLCDHHLHLHAMAAARSSVRCGPPLVSDAAGLAAALRAAVPGEDGWIRGTGYFESVAGELDATALDTMRPDVPIRIQHRSGALWILNSAALAAVGITAFRNGPAVLGGRSEGGHPIATSSATPQERHLTPASGGMPRAGRPGGCGGRTTGSGTAWASGHSRAWPPSERSSSAMASRPSPTPRRTSMPRRSRRSATRWRAASCHHASTCSAFPLARALRPQQG